MQTIPGGAAFLCLLLTSPSRGSVCSPPHANVSIFRRWFISVACMVISLSIASHNTSLSDPLTPWYLGPCERPGDQISLITQVRAGALGLSMRAVCLYPDLMHPLWQPLITLQFSKEPLNLPDVNHFVRSCNGISQLSSAVTSGSTHGTS